VDDSKPVNVGFVPLKSLTGSRPEPADALGEIRRIYFKTTKRTIEHDLAHAIELLKGMPSEDDRDKAAVYMEGLAQMRREWQRRAGRQQPGAGGQSKREGKTRTRK
jgi:hypothetical protein